MLVNNAAGMKEILYFCNVKSQARYEAAALKQRFLYLAKKYISSIEWVNGNVPKAFALVSLTTRNATFLFHVKLQAL